MRRSSVWRSRTSGNFFLLNSCPSLPLDLSLTWTLVLEAFAERPLRLALACHHPARFCFNRAALKTRPHLHLRQHPPLRECIPSLAFSAPLHVWYDSGSRPGGINSMRVMTPEELPPYPSLTTAQPTLHVSTRLWPTILPLYVATSRDLELHVRTNMLAWKAASNSFSTHTYAEVLNLVRCLYPIGRFCTDS